MTVTLVIRLQTLTAKSTLSKDTLYSSYGVKVSDCFWVQRIVNIEQVNGSLSVLVTYLEGPNTRPSAKNNNACVGFPLESGNVSERWNMVDI